MTKGAYTFDPIKDGKVVLISGGVYKIVDLYSRGSHVYAQYGTGFIRLARGGLTTKGAIRWEEVTVNFPYDKLGRMVLGD